MPVSLFFFVFWYKPFMYTFPLFVIGILEKQQKGDMGANNPSLDVCSKESVVPLVSDAMRVNHSKFASQTLRSYHRKSKKNVQVCVLALLVHKEYASRRWTIASLTPHLTFLTISKDLSGPTGQGLSKPLFLFRQHNASSKPACESLRSLCQARTWH